MTIDAKQKFVFWSGKSSVGAIYLSPGDTKYYTLSSYKYFDFSTVAPSI